MNLKKPRSKVYLLRHGEIESRNRLVGQQDLPLSEEETGQAHLWKERFQEVELSRIFCSDLYRCVRTAEIIAGSRKDIVEPVPAFREIRLGDWEGLAVAEIAHRFPSEWCERETRLATYRPPHP
jgi:broad specificity phosphatase PhoE